MTPAEYLNAEREATFRSEYIDGQIRAMEGGTINHARIVRNAVRHLGNKLSDTSCEPLSTDLRLGSDKHRVYTYPDVLVVCHPLIFRTTATTQSPTPP